MSQAAPGGEPSTNIPADVLCGIQLHMIIPSRTPIDDDSIPLILHLCSWSEDVDTHDQFRVLRFEANIMQVEKFQYVHLFMSCMFSISCTILQHITITKLCGTLPHRNRPLRSGSGRHIP